MIKDEVILRSSFLNAAERFIQKYLSTEILISKSQDNLEKFDHGLYIYNQLLQDLLNLNILAFKNNSYKLSVIENDISLKQYIIFQYIKKYKPAWYLRFKRGLIYVKDIQEDNPQIFQCLEELGIFNKGLTSEATNFIYKIKKLIYSEIETSNNLKTGMKGEKLSRDYEYQKTGIEPIYQALIDERSGFDLISLWKNGNKKYIEVKASYNNQAHITWNEWITAQQKKKNNEEYVFHFWKLDKENYELAVLSVDDLSFLGRPSEKGHHWETYLVEFNVFKKKFKKINKNLEYKK
jgi:hypothetical protein